MFLKLTRGSAISLLFFISISTFCRAETPPENGETHMTQSTGSIIGTVPTFSNLDGIPERVTFSKNSTHEANDELDIGDTLSLSWQLIDREGDADDSLSSVEWICDHPQKGRRVMATQVNSYKIGIPDVGCTISVQLQAKTVTGLPRENEIMTIDDISSYDQNDNIIDGPVNPHAIHFTQYTVAPETSESKTVPAEAVLHTGWDGAQLQLATDNVESQVEWKSSNEAVATVTQDGLLTFKSKGAVTITASNDKASSTITFNPELFFVFTTTRGTWSEALAWCTDHGYTMPGLDQLSTGADKREIPSDSLWQEWGNVTKQTKSASSVLWSSSTWQDAENAYYMYNSDGHTSSNREEVTEGIVCLEP